MLAAKTHVKSLEWEDMDREPNPEDPHLLPTNNSKEDSPRKPLVGGSSGGGGADRLKRDEWSEGAVSSLLEAYEAKWVLRNRAKLKGHDWEEVARHVSSRANCTKSPKTQTQCKNKIESMKKRYRSESATPDASSWPLFQRLDLLLRGSAAPSMPPPVTSPLVLLETLPPQPPPPPSLPPHPPVPHPHPLLIAQNSHESNGLHRAAKVSQNPLSLSITHEFKTYIYEQYSPKYR